MRPASGVFRQPIAPANDPIVCLTAIQLLGDIGTEKSLLVLRRAAQSGNPAVRNAAKTLLQQISARRAAAKAAAKG